MGMWEGGGAKDEPEGRGGKLAALTCRPDVRQACRPDVPPPASTSIPLPSLPKHKPRPPPRSLELGLVPTTSCHPSNSPPVAPQSSAATDELEAAAKKLRLPKNPLVRQGGDGCLGVWMHE